MGESSLFSCIWQATAANTPAQSHEKLAFELKIHISDSGKGSIAILRFKKYSWCTVHLSLF